MSSTCEFPLLLVVAVLAVAGAIVLFFLSRKSDEPKNGKPEKEKAPVLRDVEEEYRLGMDPCACGKPVMYTLQTCLHCVHLKHFMDNHGIEHHLVYVDDFEGEQRSEVMAKLRSFNPRGSFPTLVLPDGQVLVGFREAQARKLFGLEN